MSDNSALPGLHDIHVPAGVALWPPAPGWWMLAALVVVAIAALITWLVRRYRRNAFIREALSELLALQPTLARCSPEQAIDALAALTRRVAITRHGRSEVASHTGDRWLQFLDHTGKTRGYTQGPGRILGPARFRPDPVMDVAALTDLTRDWIRNQRC